MSKRRRKARRKLRKLIIKKRHLFVALCISERDFDYVLPIGASRGPNASYEKAKRVILEMRRLWWKSGYWLKANRRRLDAEREKS